MRKGGFVRSRCVEHRSGENSEAYIGVLHAYARNDLNGSIVGKHCSCTKDQSLYDIAQLAEHILERLDAAWHDITFRKNPYLWYH